MTAGFQLRRIPYPYRAMLAICSDLDETSDRNVYWEIMRFLNTAEQSAIGPGVGLEVGNSIYFDMPAEQFSYWNTDDTGREMVRALIRSGHIDCLHSYGDLAAKRKQAARVLDELDRHGCKLEVWVDHGTAPTNFGSDIMQGHGDEPGHEAYHADLTTDYGIKYVWRGRVTSITGQDVPASFGGIFNKTHPLTSGRTLLKEAAKRMLAMASDKKYAAHRPNRILRPAVLRDNTTVYEFIRCNPHWGGVSSCDQGRHIAEVLTEEMLNRLILRGGMCVLYTHLGKIDDSNISFNPAAVESFRRLAEMSRNRHILVTTTSRLLKYSRAVREISFDSVQDGKDLCININTTANENSISELSEQDLQGLTFYVSDPGKTRMKINGKEIIGFQQNPPDYTGRTSVSLTWHALEFPVI
ncbi:MAG: hypothetical protein A2169_11110 [Deltaproteobacteria bacterium RBG_13_47_9]|nr:MAG: hypothetical protein A2169_11110 [Deltaproteobacteria bacterium RBG_13_47_9]